MVEQLFAWSRVAAWSEAVSVMPMVDMAIPYRPCLEYVPEFNCATAHLVTQALGVSG